MSLTHLLPHESNSPPLSPWQYEHTVASMLVHMDDGLCFRLLKLYFLPVLCVPFTKSFTHVFSILKSFVRDYIVFGLVHDWMAVNLELNTDSHTIFDFVCH